MRHLVREAGSGVCQPGQYHIIGRIDRHRAAGEGGAGRWAIRRKTDRGRPELLAFEHTAGRRAKVPVIGIATVFAITQKRVAKMREMGANLVGPARDQLNLELGNRFPFRASF